MDEKVFIKLEYDRIRERLSDFAVSDLGKKACTKLIPETDPEAINKLLEETSEAEHITLTAVSYPLVGFDDVTDEISRLKLGASLSCGELLRVNRLEKAAKRAKSCSKSVCMKISPAKEPMVVRQPSHTGFTWSRSIRSASPTYF